MVNRVIDVLTEMTLKVIDVLTVSGHRCPDSYQLRNRHQKKVASRDGTGTQNIAMAKSGEL
jgi:hypothetical protein